MVDNSVITFADSAFNLQLPMTSNASNVSPMDSLLQSVFARMPTLHDADNDGSSSQSSQSDVHTPPACDENSAPIDANSVISSILATPTIEKNEQGRETWYQCFLTQSQKEIDALIYSLFACPRVEKKGDGFEHYECLNRAKFKCRFRLRVKRINEWFVVEERGSHSHSSDLASVPTQGLAKSIREIVDQSFYEDWSQQTRQQRIELEMERLGLPPNPRLNRQIDNRISYLRRVKNLSEVKRLQDEADAVQVPDCGSLQNTPTKQPQQNEGKTSKPLQLLNLSTTPESVDFTAILAQLQQQAGIRVTDSSPVKVGREMPQVTANANSAAAMPMEIDTTQINSNQADRGRHDLSVRTSEGYPLFDQHYKQPDPETPMETQPY